MNLRRTCMLILSLGIFLVPGSGAVQRESFPELKGPYLGQPCPQDRAEVFLDGVISKQEEPEMCAAFPRDGREF